MPYEPIDLPPRIVPEAITYFVRRQVDPYLADVRLMLQFPRPGMLNEPGFNLTAASVLCSVVGGLSRVFFNDSLEDRESFLCAAKRYPLADEPDRGIKDPDLFADSLYSVYRCNLAHSLGLNMKRDGKPLRWTIKPLPLRVVVARRASLPLSERDLEEIDTSIGWPSGLGPAITRQEDKLRLEVDALYCGLRRLVRSLAQDEVQQSIACETLKAWFESFRIPAAQTDTVMSSTQPTVHTSGHALVESLGVTPIIESFWAPIPDDD